MLLSSLLVLAASPFIHAASVPVTNAAHDHDHVEHVRLPKRWYQEAGHPVERLFKRGPDDGVTRPAVGSPEWAAPFPKAIPDSSQLPQEWVDALNAADAAGKIPHIPQSSAPGGQSNPVYPPGVNPSSPEICSATYKCRIAEDIWDAPDGVFASSFDDGPYPTSPRLIEFLQSNDVTTTHFMIGLHILINPQVFVQAFNAGHDIAVHTYNHLYMTTLSNLDVVAQLGWTMQIIHESTGGRVPRYWRPPYGDSDHRVRAIAKEVFGLETVIWNFDTNDWGLIGGTTQPAGIHTAMQGWLSGPKSPGLMILEHEINDLQVAAFIDAFPMIAQNGWRFESLAQLFPDRGGPYQNAESNDSTDVVPQSIVEGADSSDDSSSTTASSTEASSTTDSSSTPTTSSGTQTGLTDGSQGNSGTSLQPVSLLSLAITLIGLSGGGLLL
ncbi:hypothetical protein NMY22_g2459 [Coprinellus aureogranulatus]|nr:hypothetical protein NMY22_g2459 [Coprinellus aureogranulatus]